MVVFNIPRDRFEAGLVDLFASSQRIIFSSSEAFFIAVCIAVIFVCASLTAFMIFCFLCVSF